MLDLSNVTLLMVDTVHERVESNLEKIKRLESKIKFGDIVIFSDSKYENYRTVNIPMINSLEEYSMTCFDIVPHHIENTEYSMWIQWDGHPINIEKWNHKFLEYDFIGAPWPWKAGNYPDGGCAGSNGGFSIRSKRLTDLMKQVPPTETFKHEDAVVTDIMRRFFLENGCKYAPYELSSVFSYELPCYDGYSLNEIDSIKNRPHATNKLDKCFGFHGKFFYEEAMEIFKRNF